MKWIDADELKEWVEAWFDMNKYYHPYSKRETIPTAELLDILDRIPTVAPMKHGRWFAHDSSIKDVPIEACSICYAWSYGYNENYCPHCGAMMDEEGE